MTLFNNISKVLFLFGALVVIVSLPWAKSLSSIGIGIVSGIGLVYTFANFRSYRKADWHYILPFVFLYVLGCISYFYSENTFEAQQKLFFKIPLLLVPFCLPLVKTVSSKFIEALLGSFLSMVSIVGLLSTFHYFSNYEVMNAMVLHAKPIPVLGKITHIHFSVLNAASIFIGALLFVRNRESWYGKLTLFAASINFVMLHILAARTGLAAFYIVGVLALVTYTVKYKSLKGAFAMAALGIALIAAVGLSTSFRHRLIDTKRDLMTTLEGTYPNYYSNTQRLIALKTAYKVVRDHPITGVGIGDVNDAMQVKYDELETRLDPCNRIKPHHQFLITSIQSGLIAGLLLLLIMVLPILRKRTDWSIWIFIGLFVVAMQFEAILERQAGFYLFMLLYVLTVAGKTKAQKN